MRPQEITLAEALKPQGYTTGHFGKWHLGTLTTEIKDSNRGRPGRTKHYSPPWQNGFDVCFSTEAKVPTYNPMLKPGSNKPYGTYYWTGTEQRATENLEGDDSRVIMDRVLPFIRQAAKAGTPFLAVIWFHTPHLPVLADAEHRKPYAELPTQGQHYLGCITAMDEQVGRLRRELRDLGVAENTVLWFCADNGPEGGRDKPTNGTAGPLRGRKRSLYEGGIRVPGLLEWPARIKQARRTDVPCCTSDYYPTVLDLLGLKMAGQPTPLDGISLLPLIEGEMTERPRPIGFQSRNQLALVDNRYKIYGKGKNPKYELYDLAKDPGEKHDLAAEHPQRVQRMAATLDAWRASCKDSLAGKDYEG
jgi:arylsulfatase A-like enzyme